MAALTLALTLCPASALAAEQDAGVSRQAAVYPAEVKESEENGVYRIEKVYILSVRDDPAAIPTADFEREGRSYTLLDVIKNDQTETDTKDHIEVVTLATDTKDVAAIIQQLEPTLEVTTEDGYTGTLTPYYPGITVEADGYQTSFRTVTATRSYPNLSDADASLIPKTISDGGRTLTLADVQWQEAGGFYNATASYSGTSTSIWDGNVALAGHNRGVTNHFGKIHTLDTGDTITLTTKLGTRTYSVTSVMKVGETDNSMLAATTENCITLFTCVRDERDYRWCVRAVEA